ncbi:hypothetical protein [Microbacterium sp. Root180]|uniref:hypothetical protein n=1 Tax=Microbacterium sp. Root180 TaxID=1736483 RepID=UPI0006F22141|nr:hypothetical protein [Microbacterium sp. Root180]KRB36967.1 hypothetical protein ASD93_13205 [Microbacterium sp. Root180]
MDADRGRPAARMRLGFLLTGVVLLVVGCSAVAPPASVDPAQVGDAAQVAVLAGFLDAAREHPAVGADVYEVWVCDVPVDTADSTYYPSSLRLELHPDALAALLEGVVPEYWDTLSDGRYAPSFVAGSTIVMGPGDGPAQCLDAALGRANEASDAVLAVATAEHRPDVAGGFSRTGLPCGHPVGECPVTESGRAVYLGASDFHPDWGEVPAVDLLEHEMGHLLGWPHSGSAEAGSYDSALDVMSNSAAPRSVDPTRRHAQGTLGINRLAAGWLDASAVAVLDPETTTTAGQLSLAPAGAGRGYELLVLPVGPGQLLTVEYLDRAGLYDFLPERGVAVTLVDADAAECGTDAGQPCTSADGLHRPLNGAAPSTDLLTPDDPPWNGRGWIVEVVEVDGDATLQITADRR